MRIVNRDEVRRKLDAGQITLVEALPASNFEEAHLPGAININHDQVDELAPKLLPDKDAEIVTYCSNTACSNSGIAAARLEALGYTNVAKYAAGKQDWVEAGLPTEGGAVAAVS